MARGGVSPGGLNHALRRCASLPCGAAGRRLLMPVSSLPRQDRAVPALSTAIARSDAGRWLAFIVMLTGGLLPSVDFFIINVSLPSIHASIGADPAELQLVISGYAASYAVFLITGGRL